VKSMKWMEKRKVAESYEVPGVDKEILYIWKTNKLTTYILCV
jgi:hypothetical protein